MLPHGHTFFVKHSKCMAMGSSNIFDGIDGASNISEKTWLDTLYQKCLTVFDDPVHLECLTNKLWPCGSTLTLHDVTPWRRVTSRRDVVSRLIVTSHCDNVMSDITWCEMIGVHISLIKAGCGNATLERPLGLQTSSMARFEGLGMGVAEKSGKFPMRCHGNLKCGL